jgi:hypothetical protein
MPQSWDMGHIVLLPPEGRHAEDFYTRKNPTVSAGFEPANSGTRRQHAGEGFNAFIVLSPLSFNI